MSERIKLIWDFHGPDAEKTATHHQIHLNQFAEREELLNPISGVETLSEMHAIAFLVVEKKQMIEVRDALKPHRGFVYKQ
ncbi:MAG: hypothetical protein WDZ45_10570 [Flavobacteriaceae bacterium]